MESVYIFTLDLLSFQLILKFGMLLDVSPNGKDLFSMLFFEGPCVCH